MSTTKKDCCVTFLSCGERYNSFLLESMKTDDQFKKMMSDLDLIITTDDPDKFSDCGAKKVFKFDPVFLKDVRKNRRKKWFNFHQKRLAILHAHEEGYGRIFYMDSDIKILNWDKDFFIRKEKGFFFRRRLTKENHEDKYDFYSKLFGVHLWHYWRPVSEKIMYIHEHPHKLEGVLRVWKYLDEISRGKVNPYTEGNEILIALRFNSAQVHTYKPDPFKTKERKMKDNFGR